ncbi:hypothetical protein AAFN85_16170 [Mucilaginibacter sp. CAU 1740]|uniref:hypothetical protein n=1 Tax=Mucilaginibacter sp. CAU 1740 TaxID=3140365 RepID=UPI00325C0A1C
MISQDVIPGYEKEYQVVKLFRHISRLSIVLIIFLSLQGEVIVRYAQMFKVRSEQKFQSIKKNDERRRLIKLQCYTQKFQVLALPQKTSFTFGSPLRYLPALTFIGFKTAAGNLTQPESVCLRGPPSLS